MKIFLIASVSILIVIVVTLVFSQIFVRPSKRHPTIFPTPTLFPAEELEQRRRSGAPGPNPTEYFEYEESVRKINPKVYLSNRVPHEEATFAITKSIDWNTDTFYFVVSLKGPDPKKSREDALAWMRSLRLTDTQIQSLNISYQPEVVVKLKKRLPHDGIYFSMNYDGGTVDKTTVIIDVQFRAEGEKELDEYLQKQGVSDRSLINNLTVLYR